MERHPFLKGLSKHRGAQATCVVIFGASGDLTARKLVPALYNLGLDKLLPHDFYLLGFGRKSLSHEAFREEILHSLKKFSRRPLRQDLWEPLAQRCFFHTGDYDNLQAYEGLAERLECFQRDCGAPFQCLFYISTPPVAFEPILRNLRASGLAKRAADTPLASKVVIEKPFGRDFSSAQALNGQLKACFKESQVFRIDHYLGKETVQDLMVLRFANSIFEPLWNRHYVDCVQITVAESLGVGTRAGYYDQSGATRDMLQNHTMQLLSLVAMEPPVSLAAEDIRDEKVKLMKAILPLKVDDASPQAVRARYREGLMKGKRVCAYSCEAGVEKDSRTETYAALKLSVDNWRWKDVPFYLRSGKRLPRRVSEIAIQFKPASGSLFSDPRRFHLSSNTLVIQVQPDEGVTLLMNSKIPGLETRTQPVKMHFRYDTTFGSNTPEAYERLILDAMLGDATLFIRGDETESSWRLYTPLLDYWEASGLKGLSSYAAGSWGPLEAEHLLWQSQHAWRRPGP